MPDLFALTTDFLRAFPAAQVGLTSISHEMYAWWADRDFVPQQVNAHLKAMGVLGFETAFAQAWANYQATCGDRASLLGYLAWRGEQADLPGAADAITALDIVPREFAEALAGAIHEIRRLHPDVAREPIVFNGKRGIVSFVHAALRKGSAAGAELTRLSVFEILRSCGFVAPKGKAGRRAHLGAKTLEQLIAPFVREGEETSMGVVYQCVAEAGMTSRRRKVLIAVRSLGGIPKAPEPADRQKVADLIGECVAGKREWKVTGRNGLIALLDRNGLHISELEAARALKEAGGHAPMSHRERSEYYKRTLPDALTKIFAECPTLAEGPVAIRGKGGLLERVHALGINVSRELLTREVVARGRTLRQPLRGLSRTDSATSYATCA